MPAYSLVPPFREPVETSTSDPPLSIDDVDHPIYDDHDEDYYGEPYEGEWVIWMKEVNERKRDESAIVHGNW